MLWAHGEVYNICQVGGFLRVLRFPPPIKPTATISMLEILLKAALNTIKPTHQYSYHRIYNRFNIIVLLNGYFHIKPVLCPRQSYWVEVSCIDPRWSKPNTTARGHNTVQVLYDNYTLYKNAGFWLVNSRDIFYKFRPCIVNLQNFYFM